MKKSFFLILLITQNSFYIGSYANNNADQSKNAVVVLPVREAKLYIGISGGWHSTDSTQNYSKWDYVRKNATGFYTSFIEMWKCYYQNKVNTQTSCNDMRKAFVKGGCFFETSMETSVNTGVNGFNNEISDKRSLDFLVNAGFDVQYTSLNYGVSADRVTLLRTYNGNRKCFYLAAPWRYGGDIFSNNLTNNAIVRANILTTDGLQTDGPLGYWYSNQAGMREGSYSLVKYANYQNVESAIMLAPYAAGISGYSSLTDFLTVSKQCVLGHEDNNAAPNIWTIWTYGSDAALPNFPESVVNAQGEIEAANSKMGVAYWLLKHLNNFPKVTANTSGILPANAIVKVINDSVSEIEVEKGSQISIPITLSNENQPQIELSPVIRGIIDAGGADWHIKFIMNGIDITNDVVNNGGVNFIKASRLTKGVKVQITMQIIAKTTVITPAVATVSMQIYSNISNTINSKIGYKLTIKQKVVSANNEIKNSQFTIYPNPAKDVVNINLDEPSFLNVYNTAGNEVLNTKIESTEFSIPTNKLGGKGVYFFKVNNNAKKLIVL